MTYEERYAELMQDDTEYCCYCGEVKHSFGCCGENHFESFRQMDQQRQEEFMSYEDVE